jgi:hypothetical protein
LENAKLSIRIKISKARDFAKYLRNTDLTKSMNFEDKEIMVLGKKAKPRFSKLIIGSNDSDKKFMLGQLMMLELLNA